MGKHHGHTHTTVYNVWSSMKGRCLNRRTAAYKDYGGRGITVCDRWLDFRLFLGDMGEPPAGMTLDRIDNDKGYEPSNCRWATRTEQSLNRRSNHLLTIDGVTKPLSLWAADTGLTYATLHQRIYAYGWTPEAAVKTPVVRQRKRKAGAFCAQHGVELHETIKGAAS